LWHEKILAKISLSEQNNQCKKSIFTKIIIVDLLTNMI